MPANFKTDALVKETEYGIADLNVGKIIYSIEEDIRELNNYLFEWAYFPPKKLLPFIKEFVDSIDFVHRGTLTVNLGWYWSGALTADPWGMLDEGEEYICNALLHDNTEIVIDNHEIVMRFVDNPDSICAPVFKEAGDDWYGGNISYSYNNVLGLVQSALEKHLRKQIPEGSYWRSRYGEWLSSCYCPNCDCWYMIGGNNGPNCPKCGNPLDIESCGQ